MWKASTKCDNDLCLRVSVGTRSVWIGDSADDPAGQVPVLSVPRTDWRRFIAAVKEERWTG